MVSGRLSTHRGLATRTTEVTFIYTRYIGQFMSDGPSVPRRTFLAGSGVAAVSLFSYSTSAQTTKTLADYANADGYIDNEGVVQASEDWREGVISTSLLRRVIRYWRAGDPVVSEGSANPAQLIESHIETLGDTTFGLQIQEFNDAQLSSPTKALQFRWDNTHDRSELSESSRQNQSVDVSQLFTQARQHVTVQENDTQVNQAALPIDKGPVYIDGRELLDQLLIGASLSFERSVSVGETTLSEYSIATHRRLPEANGYVIGSEEAYISELDIQWRRPDNRLGEVRIATDMDASEPIEGLQSFEPGFRSTGVDAGPTTATSHASVSIADVTPPLSEPLTGGQTETFDITIEYDMGGGTPGDLNVSVREESWGSVDQTVPVSQQSGTTTVRLTDDIESDWDQAKLIVNLYEADSSVAVAGDEVSYQIESGSGSSQLPDLTVTGFEWSPDTPTPTDEVDFRVQVANTGDARAESIEPRVFVDGDLAYVPPTLDLDPGEQQWAVETGGQSFEAGDYTARAVVDPDDHIAEQDETNNAVERPFTVAPDEVIVTAALSELTVDDGTYTAGESVSADVTVENTGTVEHTFFVGYDVIDPSGDHYNNDAQTGQPVTLGAGETADLSLDWTVQETAPEGVYDATVTVWQESDPDSLTTRLDSATRSDCFTVSTVEQRPDLAAESLTWTPEFPEPSAPVTFETTVTNQGRGGADQCAVVLDVAGQRFDTVTLPALAPGETHTVSFAPWVATESSSVTVTVDPTNATRDTSHDNNSISRQVAVAQPTPQIGITDVEATSSTIPLGETVTTTTTLTNTGDSSHDIELTQELRGPAGDSQTDTAVRTLAAGETATVRSQWRFSDTAARGEYDLQSRARVASTTVAETTTPAVVTVTEPTGPVAVEIETLTAAGEPVDGVQVTLTPSAGGGAFSAASTRGLARFNDIPPGEYELIAESTQLHQTLSFGVAVDGTNNLTRQIRFQPTDAVYGTVFNGAGQQHLPGVTVAVPELQVTAETDSTGEFVLSSEIPDGTYEFEIIVTPDNPVIAESTAQTFRQTRTVGIDRTVTFDLPVELKQPSNDSSELLSEEDRLVSIIVRNLEKRDVLFPLEQQFITQYGLVKGIITAVQGFLEDTWELLTNLEDIPEMINGIIELISLIIDDPSVIYKLVSMMITDILDKQEADNPFEKGTIDYQTFFSAWMLGYGGIKVAISVVGTKGATKASKIAKSSSKINKSISTFKSKVGGGKLPEYSPLNRRVRPCGVGTTGVTTADTGDCLDLATLRTTQNIIANSGVDAAFREALRRLSEIRRYGNDSTVANLFDEYDSFPAESVASIRSLLSEYLWAYQLRANLPTEFIRDFGEDMDPDIVKRLDTDANGVPTLPAGDARIVIPDAYDDYGVNFEFDVMLVGRVPHDAPNGGELRIYDISEVKVSTRETASDARAQIRDNVDTQIRASLRDDGNAFSRDERYAGIPVRLFEAENLDVDSVARTVAQQGKAAFDNTLPYDYLTFDLLADNLRSGANTLETYTR